MRHERGVADRCSRHVARVPRPTRSVSMCMCICIFVCVCVCVCVCVLVRVRVCTGFARCQSFPCDLNHAMRVCVCVCACVQARKSSRSVPSATQSSISVLLWIGSWMALSPLSWCRFGFKCICVCVPVCVCCVCDLYISNKSSLPKRRSDPDPPSHPWNRIASGPR